MSDNLEVYANAELYEDTKITLANGTCAESVSITFGVNGSENITLTANSPDVLDRLCEVATDGARELRAKVNRRAGDNATY